VRLIIGTALIFGFAAPAAAQQPAEEWVFGAGGEDVVLELGGGGLVRPAYEGADDYTLRPWPVVELHYLRLPFATFGGGPETGLSFEPAFRVVPERDDDEYDLDGLGDVDLAIEIGGGIRYRYDSLQAVFELRHGFGGHEGLIGEAGVDLVLDPTPKLSLSLGPRLYFADSDYLDTYLGVTPAQSAASGLAVFDPDGGLKGAGLEAEGRYALSPRWALVGKAGYEHLIGDAADSPVTALGSEHQFLGGLGLTYRFGLDLFD
jgi:outer membrane scaffolding protein for murein synthesis (MipA/OmpV family)